MITKESLKGRGFEIRTYRTREPKPVPESQKKARNPQAIAMCTQILVKPGPFLGPRSILEGGPFLGLRNAFKSSHRSDKRIGVLGARVTLLVIEIPEVLLTQ